MIDAWFDSGSMPAAQVGYPHAPGSAEAFAFPADFISEAIDQTRGWFYSLLAINTLVFGESPYRHVVCLGHIVDADGRKMSKSLGNIIDPWQILDTRGADAMRWWMFSQGSPWTPTRATLGAIDTAMRDMLLTLWNTFSFFTTYASLNGFDPADPTVPAPAERGPLDRWILSRLASTTADGDRRAARPTSPWTRPPPWPTSSTTCPTGTCAAAAAASGAPIPTRPPATPWPRRRRCTRC